MKNKPTVTIAFPTLWLIPVLSVIYSVIRVYDGIDWNFATTIVIAPMLTYLGWCIGYIACICLSVIAMKFYNKKED